MSALRWSGLRRACEREAVKRAWGFLWQDAERQARASGRDKVADLARVKARRAFKRAARIRRAVLNTNTGRA